MPRTEWWLTNRLFGQPVPDRHHTMRWLFSLAYFGCWLIAGALLFFVPALLLWEIAKVSHLTGIDDDVTLLALPMGALLGAWGAVRSRHAYVLQRVISIFGILISASGTFMAIGFVQSSERAAGSGPFAGIGELLEAGMSIVIAVYGACMFGIWAFARLARFGEVEEHQAGPADAGNA